MCSVVLEMRHADEWADPDSPLYLISCSALFVRNCVAFYLRVKIFIQKLFKALKICVSPLLLTFPAGEGGEIHIWNGSVVEEDSLN